MTTVLAPVAGVAVRLGSVPDPVFSEGLVGPGVAIEPDRAPGRVLSPIAGTIVKLHPHAFVVDGATGMATRLEATRPPLGVASKPGKDLTRPWRPKQDILCLFTDGIVDASGESAPARFGEERVLGHVRALRDRPVRDILEAIYADLAAFTGGGRASDDRTLVLLKG